MGEIASWRKPNNTATRERPDRLPYIVTMPRGISEKVVKAIAHLKSEPVWMREQRLAAFRIFLKKKMPDWGADLSGLDFNNIHYYLRPTAKVVQRWRDVPLAIRRTYRRLGLPQAEQKYLAGVMAQYESEPVYHGFRDQIAKLGVIFTDMDTALRRYPELFRKYFSSVVPVSDNKFSALNAAVWSGGSFVYVPAGVKVEFPLQAYFRINAEKVGQFEHTLIIAEEGSQVHYIEGCTAPMYSTESLHSGVVEIVVKKGARVRYTTIQNWSKNVYNLVTQRSHVYEEGTMEWVDGNLGSKVTMKYPAVYLLGRRARGSILSIALAGQGQHQDVGAKAVHGAPDTSSTIVSKSVSYASGRSAYRGLVRVPRGMTGVKSNAVCDALILGQQAKSDTYPAMDVKESQAQVSHEAHVGKVSEEQLFYLQSRGLAEEEAMSLIISGFIEPIAKELPVEYAAELNQLIQLEMRH